MKIDFSSEIDVRRWRPILALLLAALVCAIVYGSGLSGPMLLDDYPQLGSFFQSGAAHAPALRQVIWSGSGPLGRPVSMLTFWLNSLITPGDLSAWKLVNVLIHCATGVLAGLLAMELFAVAARNTAIDQRYVGAFVGIVWLLHPLQVSTVLYTVQRMTQLSALFTLAGLYAYARMRRRGPAATLGDTLWGLGVLSLMTALAAFSKENGLLLPFIALAMEVALFHGRGTRAAARAIRLYFGGVVFLAALAATLLFVMQPDFITIGYAFRGFTLSERLLTEPRILFDYLRMIFLPIPGSMGFFHDDVVLSTGLTHPATTVPALLGLIALAVSAWLVRRRFPLVALGLAIFLIGQSMESSVLALLPMFEHRNYLPSFGIILGATELLAASLARRNAIVPLSVAGTVMVTLTLLSAIRVAHWSSGFSFYKAAVRAHPASDSAAAGLAQIYLDAAKPDAALQVLAGHDSFGTALQRAYISCTTTGGLPSSELTQLSTQDMGHLNSYPVTGLTMLGALGIQGKCRFSDAGFSQLVDRAAQAASTKHDLRYMLYIYSGYYHQRLNQLPQAAAAMQRAHQMDAGTPVPLILAARWYLQAGKPSDADRLYQEAQVVNRRFQAGFDQDLEQLHEQIKNSVAQHGPKMPRAH